MASTARAPSRQSTDRALLTTAASLTILADSTKFGRSGPVRLLPPTALHRVITDGAADADRVQSLRSMGIEVVLC